MERDKLSVFLLQVGPCLFCPLLHQWSAFFQTSRATHPKTQSIELPETAQRRGLEKYKAAQREKMKFDRA